MNQSAQLAINNWKQFNNFSLIFKQCFLYYLYKFLLCFNNICNWCWIILLQKLSCVIVLIIIVILIGNIVQQQVFSSATFTRFVKFNYSKFEAELEKIHRKTIVTWSIECCWMLFDAVGCHLWFINWPKDYRKIDTDFASIVMVHS